MYFLCDAIHLQQSLEGTVKVLGRFFLTVLEEVYFVVNLYSFPLPLAPQANSSFPKVSYLPPSQSEQRPKPLPSFCVIASFLRISQLPGQNQQDGKQSSLPLLYFKIRLPRGLSLSRMLVEFSHKLLYSTHAWDKFSNLWSSHSQKMR